MSFSQEKLQDFIYKCKESNFSIEFFIKGTNEAQNPPLQPISEDEEPQESPRPHPTGNRKSKGND